MAVHYILYSWRLRGHMRKRRACIVGNFILVAVLARLLVRGELWVIARLAHFVPHYRHEGVRCSVSISVQDSSTATELINGAGLTNGPWRADEIDREVLVLVDLAANPQARHSTK